MLHFNLPNGKRRLLSTFLALTLLLGSLSYPVIPASASNVVSNNDARLDDNHSDASPSSDADKPATEDGKAIPPESSESSADEETDSSLPEDDQDIPSQGLPDASSDSSSEINRDYDNSQSEDPLSEIPDSSEQSNSDTDAETPVVPEDSLDQAQAGATTFTLTFDYNGAVDEDGNTSFQVTAQKNEFVSEYIKQAEAKNLISPYQFKNKWDEYETDSETGELIPTGKTRNANTTKKVTTNYTYKAVWGDFATFTIDYRLDGGSFDLYSGEYVPYSYTYNDVVTIPKAVQKKGYIFKGFYKDSAFTGSEVTAIPLNSIGNITLYAKWEAAAPKSAPTLSKVTNPSSGKIKVAFKKMKDIEGYELLMSTKKNFKSNVNTLPLKASASSAQLTNMPKGKTYYFKLRAYNTDSVGERAYSKDSKVLKIKVTKGVKEYKATSSSAKLKKCSISKMNTLTVSYTVSKRIKSSDDSYYLVALEPNTNKYMKVIDQTIKQKNATFTLPLRDDNDNDLIQYKYALAVKSGSKYQLLSSGAYISNPEAAAAYTAAFPKSHSKKGLQMPQDSSMISDLNLSHTFINMDLNHVLSGSNLKLYRYNGKTYHFNDAWGPTISALNDMGVTVTCQIMISYNESTKYMILKSGRKPGKPFYAINVQEKKARETFEAVMSFLAETYSQSDCHVDNWILGNEVNIHPEWYYAGNISRSAFMKNYAGTFRIMYYAVRSHSKNSRVYICTDHTWSDRNGDWGAKPFMEAFNKEIKAQQKNIQWNLAYHAYPSILTSAATWKDTLAPNDTNADFVSPKNLSILTKYVKKNFGSKTRIILSEQGFTSSSGTDVQAAAIAYTYYKAEFDPMIDAVIFRSDIDNGGEAAQGLYFGLKDSAGNQKPAYNVFKYMDTTGAEKYTKPYLKTIGISKWKDIAPKYDLKRFK